jgi:hypothetical protein
MRRWVAVLWHTSFCGIAAALYFVFVLPRWWELTGDTSRTLGTVLRIVTGALIGLAALPVVFTLLRTRRPEFGTPQLALTLRSSSIGLHILAGVLIIGTAISEIWISLDTAGQWLFGIYGAAAAIALLGVLAFHLAYVAELPPPPPKPLKPKEKRQRRRGRRKADEDEASETGTTESEEATESEDELADVTAEEPESAAEEETSTAQEATESAEDKADEPAETESSNGKLRNRRQSGKETPRRRRRLRGGVAVED